MKQRLVAAIPIVIAVLIVAQSQVFAQSDTLIVYANGPRLNAIVARDTLANGTRAHHVYKLVSLDTTYLFDGTITVNTDVAFIGVPHPTTKRTPCIQPDVLPDNSIPGLLFTLNGKKTKGTFKNLYLLGIAINNVVNYGGGQAIQISADSIRLEVDNVIFENWSQFAIGYSGNWDKFFITNCKFRNMTTQPNQWYVGEVLRNENYIAAFKTDSIVIRYNTMLCVSGYATAATGGIVKYYEFSHNNVVYTFKNVFFLDRAVNAKFNNNLFFAAYAGGQNQTEFNGGWDSFTAKTIASIITMGPLDSLTAADLLGHASTGAEDPAAEALRKVEVKNNAYFWPAALTAFWQSWNDTAHVDSIYTPVWMNSQSVNMFTDKTKWPGFVQSGNQNVDPGFGASILAVLNPGTGNNVGLLNWFSVVRRGTGTTQLYGYPFTVVGTAANWVPPWPLPETNDMQYSNAALKTGGTDGGPIGDPNWFGILLDVKEASNEVPQEFTLMQNYPNPFNPTTNISFGVKSAGHVKLVVFNTLGQEVRTLVDQEMAPGTFVATWDGRNNQGKVLGSGVYFYRLEAKSFTATKSMVLLK
jgi:FlgD Ig-like domain